MKSFVLTAAAASLLATSAMAQMAPATGTTEPATGTMATGTETTQPMTGSTATGETNPQTMGMEGEAIVILPARDANAAPSHFLADDLIDEDVYGMNNEEIGEVEDIVLSADGSVAAIAVEVGGFLGIGDKDVLVNWNSVEVVVEGDDVRLLAPTLTREMLENAEGVDLDDMVYGR